MNGFREIVAYRMRALVVAAFLGAMLLASQAGVASAAGTAEPFHIDFSSGVVKVGAIDNIDLATLADGSAGSIDGTIQNGVVTIPADGFNVVKVGIDDPFPLKAFLGVDGASTGTYDADTGELNIEATGGIWVTVDIAAAADALGVSLDDLLAGANLGALAPIVTSFLKEPLTCGFAPMDLHFSTSGGEAPGPGTPFSDGLADPGAISASWSQLGPFAGRTKAYGLFDVCVIAKSLLPGLIQSALSGVGGSSLGSLQGIDIAGLLANLDDANLGPSGILLTSSTEAPPTAAKLRTKVLPRNRKIREGHATRFKVTVTNSGGSKATRVKVCVRHPNKALSVRHCQKFGNIPAGGSETRAFRVRPRGNAGGRTYSLSFITKERSLTQNNVGARVRVR